jgi:uncharacterized membrane protein SpoIIM required for sporulation
VLEKQEKENRRVGGTREALWRRLGKLLERGESGLGKLDDEELEELGRLYRMAATHLALLRGFGSATRTRDRLNDLVVRAHHLLYRQPKKTRRKRPGLAWFLIALPLTVRRTWKFHLLAFVVLMGGALYGFLGCAFDPEWSLEVIMDERTAYASQAELREVLDESFGSGNTENLGGKTAFSAFLWQNNVRVALLAFFSGFLLGLPTLLLLFFNGLSLGAMSYSFHHRELDYEWWAWILPHGITEMLAIILLAGGGLWMGRILLDPGHQTRAQALREARGGIFTLALAAFPMLALAAFLESFLRQSSMGLDMRYTFATASALLWALYLVLAGRNSRMLERMDEGKTLAERAIPLPADEEMMRSLIKGGRRT